MDQAGRIVLLDAQDRRRWRADEIAEGLALVEQAARRSRPGSYLMALALVAGLDTAPPAAGGPGRSAAPARPRQRGAAGVRRRDRVGRQRRRPGLPCRPPRRARAELSRPPRRLTPSYRAGQSPPEPSGALARDLWMEGHHGSGGIMLRPRRLLAALAAAALLLIPACGGADTESPSPQESSSTSKAPDENGGY
jgi:hypothetical protein